MNILLNGVGRIGKSILRIANSFDNFNIVAINEINSNKENIAYSINYDSTYGRFDDKFELDGDFLKNSKRTIKILNHKSLFDIDFKFLNIDIVIDASGSITDTKKLQTLELKHIFLTHPNKNADINVVIGVNDEQLSHQKIISTSSCNATALMPLLKIIDDKYDIDFGDITTVHPLLNHQKTLDSGCIGSNDRDIKCNFEFGRSSTQNIIPSQTTTIDACSYINVKFNFETISSNSMRVPTSTVGAINVTLVVNKDCQKDTLIEYLKQYQETQKNKIVFNNFEPLVSSDFQAQEYTTIIDHRYTQVIKNSMVKIVLWYDNEWGYASKVVDIVNLVLKK